jgi:hypothetical protein
LSPSSSPWSFRIRVVITENQIFWRLWYQQLLTVWDGLHCKWQIWIFHCVFRVGGDPCYVCWTKVAIGWKVFWFPPNHGNGEQHLARTIYSSYEKPHTHFTTNMRGPAFILFTYFTPKIKLITFLN